MIGQPHNIVLLGGPADGEEMTVGGSLPWSVKVALEIQVQDVFVHNSASTFQLRTALYVLHEKREPDKPDVYKYCCQNP